MQFPAVLVEEGRQILGVNQTSVNLWRGQCHPPIAQLGLLRPGEVRTLLKVTWINSEGVRIAAISALAQPCIPSVHYTVCCGCCHDLQATGG